jgi:predicted NBD/HSP70 family sugar kinase
VEATVLNQTKYQSRGRNTNRDSNRVEDLVSKRASDRTSHQPDVDTVSSSSAGTGGSNLSRVRAHNERLVLSLIRTEALSRAEIARRTGLSPQTITLITRALTAEGLIHTGEPIRGKVGQPSVPLTLDADGAYFLGLKIGRRSAELILMNFIGDIVQHRHEHYGFPAPQNILAFLAREIPAVTRKLGPQSATKLHGLGIAMPYELWNWSEKLGAPKSVMNQWRDFQFHDELSELTDLPIFVENDATSACGAELTFGRGQQFKDFAYFFVGYFIGGGIVLNSSVYLGHTGNAGAFGSLPVIDQQSPGGVAQLIDTASVYILESSMECRQALAGHYLDHDSEIWSSDLPELNRWLERVNTSLAMAIASVSSVVDVNAIIIDGGFPQHIRERIIVGTRQALAHVNTKGIVIPDVHAGMIGPGARALGAARLPLFARFLLDQSVLTSGAG